MCANAEDQNCTGVPTCPGAGSARSLVESTVGCMLPAGRLTPKRSREGHELYLPISCFKSTDVEEKQIGR